jgi:hypothetical protein
MNPLKEVGDTEVPFLKRLGAAIAGIRENPQLSPMMDAVLPLLLRGVVGAFGAATLSGSQCPSLLKATLLLSWSGKLEWAGCTARLPGQPCPLVALRVGDPPTRILMGLQALHL